MDGLNDMSTLNHLIEVVLAAELRELPLFESWRGFSLKQFKRLATPNERVDYAASYLPKLGRGAARVVFGLGSGKVLKIAHKKSGSFQNRNEVEAYTSSRAQDFLAKIYDADEEYMWLISEGLKVLADNDDLLQKFTVSEMVIEEVVTGAHQGKTFEESLVDAVEYHNTHYKDDYGPFHTEAPIELEKLNKLDIELFRQAYEATKVGIEDLDRYDHWGITVNGRLVIADYGLTEEGFRDE